MQTTLPILEQHSANIDGVEHIEYDNIVAMQTRAKTHWPTVEAYAERYRADEYLPPVVVFKEVTGHAITYHLADGHHRYLAAGQCDHDTIEAIVKDGNARAALWYAAQANSHHGLNLTNEDKRSIVDRILDDEEWASKSDRELATHIGSVSHTFVGKRRKLKNPDTETIDDGAELEPTDTINEDTFTVRGNPIDDTEVTTISESIDNLVEQLKKDWHRWDIPNLTVIAALFDLGATDANSAITWSELNQWAGPLDKWNKRAAENSPGWIIILNASEAIEAELFLSDEGEDLCMDAHIKMGKQETNQADIDTKTIEVGSAETVTTAAAAAPKADTVCLPVPEAADDADSGYPIQAPDGLSDNERNYNKRLRTTIADELNARPAAIGYADAMALAMICGFSTGDLTWDKCQKHKADVDAWFYEKVQETVSEVLASPFTAATRDRLPNLEKICQLYGIDYPRQLELAK